MPINQLDTFMQAIAQQESGGNYNAKGPNTGSTYGHAQGKYQIMETIWPGWAAEAGIPNADPWDPAAQEHVARHKMTQYYNRYGSWPLVAIAWFAGPGRANTAAEHGIDAVGGISDVLGTDVRTYVDKMMSGMDAATAAGGQVESGGGRTEGTGPTSPMATAGSNEAAPHSTAGLPEPELDPDQEFVDQRRASSDTMAQIMAFISESASRDGGRVLDVSAMFGDAFGSDDEEDDDATVEVG